MKSIPAPTTHSAITTEELTLPVSTGGPFKRTVVVPKGTKCRKIEGNNGPWVVHDLGFIEDKRSILYSDADIYGIIVPEEKLAEITPLHRS